MPAYTLIERPDQIAPQLSESSRIGVDTEFMRERTYFSQLCLVQIALGETHYCVDPLADNPMQEFWAAICNRTWVAHSARQDIEVIYQTAQLMPAALFDTQVAAGLLGYQPQMGYGNLVQELFDVELPKTHTRANWAARPLPATYLEYAAEDVEYLLPAYEILAERLDKLGRLTWAESDSNLLLDPALYAIDPKTAIERLKGARKLRGKRRIVAEQLAEWRENEALRCNRPRQWIVRDNVLVDIAWKMPSSAGELADIDGMQPKFVERNSNTILNIVAAAAGETTDYLPRGAPDEAQKALLKKMQKTVAECAADLDISAETIASKKELSSVIIDGNRDSRVFTDWRRELIGDQLSSLL